VRDPEVAINVAFTGRLMLKSMSSTGRRARQNDSVLLFS
jgi:hypothetical protein